MHLSTGSSSVILIVDSNASQTTDQRVGSAGTGIRSRMPGILRGGCTLYVAYWLLNSAIAHLQDPYYFLSAILDYQILPPWAAVLGGAALPFFHLSLASGLLLLPDPRPALQAASGLFGVYTTGQLVALIQGRSISCGCFGFDETAAAIGWPSVLLSGSLVACSVIGQLRSLHRAVAASSVPGQQEFAGAN